MKTFRMIVLAVIAAVAIGGLSVEALMKKVWCTNRDDCPFNTRCLTNMRMRKESNSCVGGSDDIKSGGSGSEDVVEIILTHGKGLCSEIVQLGLTLVNFEKLRLCSKEGDAEKRGELEEQIRQEVATVFCEVDEDCEKDGKCQHWKQEHEKEEQKTAAGVCSNVVNVDGFDMDGSVVASGDLTSKLLDYYQELKVFHQSAEHETTTCEECKGYDNLVVLSEIALGQMMDAVENGKDLDDLEKLKLQLNVTKADSTRSCTISKSISHLIERVQDDNIRKLCVAECRSETIKQIIEFQNEAQLSVYYRWVYESE
eukprot:GHVS01062669.1.p1 GENE.GHVS01062669.1~~GHVS01062669.1.p1  ORF type:complete len:312 (-),score=31.48 GHVS01062669.1:169-1104(-)